MSTISFNCEVTEHDVIPNELNDELVFSLNNNFIVINLMAGEDILEQTEISKKDAIDLANLILLKYGYK